MSDKNDEKFSADFIKAQGMTERLSYASKKAYNFRWAERRAQSLDALHPDSTSKAYQERVEDNYRLIEGLPMKNYTKEAFRKSLIGLKDLTADGIDAPNVELEHFDVISPMLKGLHGDQQRRKLNYIITDSSLFTQNYIKETQNQMLSKHFDENLFAPARAQALIQWQMDNGVEDLFSLSPEERQQLEVDINKSVESLIPMDIVNFMKYGAKGRIEKQGQAIADALVSLTDLKFEADDAYLHRYANDAIIFETGIRRNKPFVEWVDPMYFNTGGTTNLFIDHNPWFKRVEYLSPVEIMNKWGDQFTREDRKKFDELITLHGENNNDTQKDRRFLMAIDFDGQKRLHNTNLLTKKGQTAYGQLLDDYSGAEITNYENIRVAKIVWSSLRKMKLITKGYGDGTLRYEWYSEEYQFNTANGDLDEEIHWVPEYWQTTIIGESVAQIFVDKGPVPCQFRDITDPYVVRSPFTGAFFNDLRGHGSRMTDIDRAKPYIHMINFQMRAIKEKEATDIGKVMMITVAAKPKGWTWEKLFATVRATKILPINTQQSGLTPADLQLFRDIDLGNMYDIAARISYLQYLISRVSEVLSANSARQGQQAASTSVTNNMTNLGRSFAQTHSGSVLYDKIMERVIENLIYLGKKSIKSGNIFLRRALDDLSIANIDIDIDELDEALFNVKVVTDEVDVQQLDMLKNFILPYVQNPQNNLSLRYASQILYAASRGELLDIADQAELEVQINRANAMEFEKMSAQETRQWEQSIMELKHNYEMELAAINNEAKKEMAALQSMTIAHGNDINQNNENDYLESADKEREFKREKTQTEAQVALQKIAVDRELKLQELGVLQQTKREQLELDREFRSKELEILRRNSNKKKQ